MSTTLIFLTLICLAMASAGLIDTNRLLHFPVAAGMLMLAFIIPQAYAIERLNLADLLEPSYSWLYFTVCMVMVFVGWVLGRKMTVRPAVSVPNQSFAAKFNLDRLLIACVAMSVVGGYSYFQMSQLAAVGDYGSHWTGVITLYYLLATLLVMSLSLSWLTYLRSGKKVFLLVAILSLLIFLPTLTVSVKRSWIFEVAIVLLGGMVFVRHYVPNRVAVIAGILVGTILLHQVGEVRSHIRDNETTAVEAIADGALTNNLAIVQMDKAPEVQGAVTQIAVSRAIGEYEPGLSIWNRLVHQYVPAFIVGQDLKDGLKFRSEIRETVRNEYFWSGATPTGFSDSFAGFWWFGSLCFLAIAFFYGRYWEIAKSGDLRAQFLYLALLNDGLIAITESISRFISNLPFILIVTIVIFWFARAGTQPRSAAGARLGGGANLQNAAVARDK